MVREEAARENVDKKEWLEYSEALTTPGLNNGCLLSYQVA